MELQDSRRLTGPNLLLDGPGAVIDATVAGAPAEGVVAAWKHRVHAMLHAVGWEGETVAAALHPGGVTLAFTAPVDALYAATEVNEWAWEAAVADVTGAPAPDAAEAAARLREVIAAERNPRLLALRDEALRRGVAFLPDDTGVSVGLGAGGRTFPLDAIPAPGEVDWASVHDIPVALVTGTNGKTTTVRMVSAIAQQAGRGAGYCSTDEVAIRGVVVDRGDYSGPQGARRVLRDPAVEVAVLETARGGLLRRGLFVARAEAALVTNVDADHMGEYGIHDVEALARAKLLVARAVGERGRLVLNADDPVLVRASAQVRAPLAWFSRDHENPLLLRHLASGGHGAYAEHGMLVLARGAERVPMLRVEDVPATMGGAAAHNVSNALAAAALADALGFDAVSITRGLRGFGARNEQNEGRLERYDVGGVRVLVDFAHNPHAMRALVAVAASLPAARRAIVLGQAGDRDDGAIRDLVRTAASLGPQRVFVKEMLGLLRGRQAGEIPALIAAALREAGVQDDAVDGPAPTELDAIRRAFAWARAGDLLVLPVHKDRGAVMALLRGLLASGWAAGDPLPDVHG